MARTNGIIPSSIPFERRYRPPDPKRRKREPMTATDRFVCAVMGGFLGFVMWAFGYFILLMGALKSAAKHPAVGQAVDPIDRLPPFAWGTWVALAFALFGAVVGAERMMDAFAKVLRVESEVASHMD